MSEASLQTSGSAYVRTRVNKQGKKSYQVIYRRGGRLAQQHTAGTFKTKAAAEARAKLVEMDIALGLDPKARFALVEAPTPTVKRTFEEWFDAWIETRVDLANSSGKSYAAHRGRLVEAFGGRDPQTITQEEIQALVISWLSCAKPMAASSIEQYWTTLRVLLRYAGVNPNPAEGVRLPKIEKKQVIFFTRNEFARVLEHLQEKHVLFFRLLEATGVRIGEMLKLCCEDVDWAESRVLLFKTKNDMQHWVDIPEPLMLRLAELVPEEERQPGRRVFAGVRNADSARRDWREAYKKAGVTRSTPHALRHRRISLWVKQGIDIATIEYRVGHLDKGETYGTYTHVVMVDDDEWSGVAT